MRVPSPLRPLASILLLGALGAIAACSASSDPAPAERACTGSQALSAAPLVGESLPPKTIALTFDDGPGARSMELSRWLKDQGVHASWFVNGKMLDPGGRMLGQLVADGHIVANHTQTHPNLMTLEASGVVAEVEQTDTLLAPFVPDNRFLFRPPFGAYDANTFAWLEASAMKKYVGPIGWDIGNGMGPASAADWDCWQAVGTSDPPVLDVKTCGDLYLAEIRAKGHGIVLLHDPYFIDDDPAKGGTVDMVEYMVPLLKNEGYTFVTVDEVPQIAALLPPLTPRAVDAGAAPDAGSSSGGSDSTPPISTTPQPPIVQETSPTDPCAPAPQAAKQVWIESGGRLP